jgi:peroxiredoxin
MKQRTSENIHLKYITMKINKNIIIACLVILLTSLILISFQKDTIDSLDMTTINGEKITSKDLLGKVVLINFWATDCPGCIAEMPGLINTYKKYKNQNFELIAVSMFYDPPSHVLSFSKNNSLPFPVVLDIEKKIAAQFSNVTLTPTSFLINHQGKIINRIIGEINFDEFDSLLQKAIKKSISSS